MGGMRGSSHKRVPMALKLPQLQNLVKRDRDGYRDEFLQQHRNYLSELEIFKLKPSKQSDRFAALVTFMSHVAPCYKSETKEFGPQLKDLLEQHGPVLHPSIRMKLVQALILLRNRGVMDPTGLLSLFFGLFRCQDKSLRTLLYEHIISDIKNINDKGRNPRLNKSIQGVVHSILKDESEIAAKKSLDIMVHLYRKRVWVDARTVNVIASALVSETPRLSCTALNFFLNIDGQMADDDEEEDKQETAQSAVNFHSYSKKTAKRVRSAKKAVKINKKKARSGLGRSDDIDGGSGGLFPAINLLHDPQGTAEKVFRRLRQSKQRFEVKLLMMNFISRVVGAHRLLLLPFYSHLQRYVASQQREVTHILAYMVQACHELVPPDELMPVIKAVAYNFVTERCPGEVMALGINTIREVAKRIPAVLEEEGMDFLVQDLAAYSKHNDKSVVVASRSFINFVRETYPSLLKTRDRGKDHDITARPAKYGDQKLAEGVDGADLLTLHEQGLLPLEDGEEAPELVELQEKEACAKEENTLEVEDIREGIQEDDENKKGKKQKIEDGREGMQDDDEEEEQRERERGAMNTQEEGEEGGNGEEEAMEEGGDVMDMQGDKDEGVEEENYDDDEEGDMEEEEAVEGEMGEMQDELEEEDHKEGKGAVADNQHEGEGEGEGAGIGMDDKKEEEVNEDRQEDSVEGGRRTKRARRSRKGAKLAGDVKGSSDGISGNVSNEEAATEKVRVPAHLRVDGTRILTAEDFEKIKQLKQRAASAALDRKLGRKRKRNTGGGSGDVDAGDDSEDSEERGDGGQSFAVEPRQLEGYRKRRRATLEERLEGVIRGREKFQTMTHAGGLTNLEKERKKNFLMVRKGKSAVKGKTRLGDKQVMARNRKGAKVQMKRDRRKKRRT